AEQDIGNERRLPDLVKDSDDGQHEERSSFAWSCPIPAQGFGQQLRLSFRADALHRHADRAPHVHDQLGQDDFSCWIHWSQPTYSRGSVISPVTALAATVSGLARYTRASLCPMRPG